jgi:hypothetical protein
MDIVEMVELIMNRQYERAGDLYPAGNPDGVINGMDLVEEVELVMSQTAGNHAPALAARTERLAMKSERSGVKSLGIQSDRPFILAQMTVELSEGMTLSSITSDRRHEVAYRQTADNKYVVVCYSNRNETFEANVFHNLRGRVKLIRSALNGHDRDVLGASALAWGIKEYSLFK